MLVHLRGLASVVAVVLVGLSVLVLDSSSASALSSIDSPQGLVVMGDEVFVGSQAVAGTAGTAAGVTGVSIGQSAAGGTAGVAASVGLYGWLEGWFNVGEDVAGLSPGEPTVPGWTKVPEQWYRYKSLYSIHARVDAIAYDAALRTVSATISAAPYVANTGLAGRSSPLVRCKNSGGQSWTSYLGGTYLVAGTSSHMVTCPVGFALDAVTWGVGRWEQIVGDEPAVLTDGTWYPEGDPRRPPDTEPGSGTITRDLECVGADGSTVSLSDSTPVSIVQAGSYELPALTCPDGMVAGGFGGTWTPDGAQGETTVIPDTDTEPWVRDIPTEYPDCLTEVCRLQLWQIVPQPTTSCGALAVACPEWYTDPGRAENYECRWGPYVVDLDRCSVFRVPGQVLPNADPAPDGTITYLPWPPLPGETPDPADEPESSDCWPNGWSGFNPAQWVLQPVGCALRWAFVPRASAQRVADIVDAVQTKTPVPELGSIAGALEPPEGGSLCITLSLPIAFVIGHDQPFLDSCTWSDPISQLLRDYRPLFAIAVWVSVVSPLAWWAWRQYAPGSTGTA